jgi:hypothetical protein
MPCAAATGAPLEPRLMLDWLVGNSELLGLAGQNWMWLIGGGLLLYVVTLAIARRRHAGLR